ncbi:NUDIX hydrolase domain-like protein [Hyaloraphidium curvatum]|nr:NUDIX hydrolase domain-like protein [Hyaloraphidium curvatum]
MKLRLALHGQLRRISRNAMPLLDTMAHKPRLAGARSPDGLPRVVEKSLASNSETKWVSLSKITYQDVKGKTRFWEVADRRTRPKAGDCDAVAILPLLVGGGEKAKTILVTQYRPPVDSYTVELPAGLIDEGETPEQTAVRELKEETGYTGTVVKVSSLMVNDPGMISANMRLVVCKVDLSAPENHDSQLQQRLEDGEYIQRWIVPIDEALDFINELQEGFGYLPDARLAHFFLALDLLAKVDGGKM